MLSSFSFSKDTVGFILEGTFDNNTSEKLHQEVLEKLTVYPKINLYLEDDGIEEFTLPSLVKELLFKLKHADKFTKVAIVSDQKWLKMCGSIENMIMTAQVKNFSVSERLEAISWIAHK